jgi:hypothetical protein
MFKPPRLFGDGEATRPPRFSGRTSGPRSLTTRRATGLRPGWPGVQPAREGRPQARRGRAGRDGSVSGPLARAATTPAGVRAPARSPRPRPSRARLYPFPFPPFSFPHPPAASRCPSTLTTSMGLRRSAGAIALLERRPDRTRLGRPETPRPGSASPSTSSGQESGIARGPEGDERAGNGGTAASCTGFCGARPVESAVSMRIRPGGVGFGSEHPRKSREK